MRRPFLIVACVVLALAVTVSGLPYWLGLETEKFFAARMEQLARSGGIMVIRSRYERGWLGADAETVLRYPGLPVDVVAHHRISHGPIALDRWLSGEATFEPVRALIRSRLTLHAPSGASSPALWGLSALPPLITETTVALDGTGIATFEVHALKAQLAGGSLDWRGLRGELRFDAQWKRFALEARSPGLILNGLPGKDMPLSELRLVDLSLRSQLEEGTAGYFFGDSTFTLESFAAGPIMRLHGLRFASTARPEADNVALDSTYEVNGVQFGAERYGPGRLSVTVRRLDAAALSQFEKELGAIYRQDLPAEQTSLMVLGKALALIATLSKKAPELEVTDFRFKIKEDEIRGKAKLVLDGSRLDTLENPLLLLAALRGEAEIAVPAGALKTWLAPRIQQDIQEYARRGLISQEEIARLTPQRLARIVDEALPHYLGQHELARHLIRDGASYKLIAAFRRGQLLINNEPWRGNLAMMMP